MHFNVERAFLLTDLSIPHSLPSYALHPLLPNTSLLQTISDSSYLPKFVASTQHLPPPACEEGASIWWCSGEAVKTAKWETSRSKIIETDRVGLFVLAVWTKEGGSGTSTPRKRR
nr:hypothetical protein HmN_000980500 [Hymenolepis microstoma]